MTLYRMLHDINRREEQYVIGWLYRHTVKAYVKIYKSNFPFFVKLWLVAELEDHARMLLNMFVGRDE